MTFNRRHLAFASAGALCAAAFGHQAAAESGADAGLAQAVESFRKAMLAADKSAFETLCADQLSYGHSSGKLESKSVFITNATNGKSRWKSLNFGNETNMAVGDIGISRFILTGETESEGKTNAINIGVLTAWQKQGNQWKLLARQAYTI
jgi:hypothetical protein